MKIILRDVLLCREVVMGKGIVGILNNGVVGLCGKQREFYQVEYT